MEGSKVYRGSGRLSPDKGGVLRIVYIMYAISFVGGGFAPKRSWGKYEVVHFFVTLVRAITGYGWGI